MLLRYIVKFNRNGFNTGNVVQSTNCIFFYFTIAGDSSIFFLVCNYGNLQIGDHNVMYAGDGNHDNDDEVISPASTEDVQNLNSKNLQCCTLRPKGLPV